VELPVPLLRRDAWDSGRSDRTTRPTGGVVGPIHQRRLVAMREIVLAAPDVAPADRVRTASIRHRRGRVHLARRSQRAADLDLASIAVVVDEVQVVEGVWPPRHVRDGSVRSDRSAATHLLGVRQRLTRPNLTPAFLSADLTHARKSQKKSSLPASSKTDARQPSANEER
jgi:hypothetical protein